MIVRMVDYRVLDGGNLEVRFQSSNPAPYFQSDFTVVVTDAEVPSNINQNTLRTLLTDRLQRKYGNVTINGDGMPIGQGIAPLNTLKAANSDLTVTT